MEGQEHPLIRFVTEVLHLSGAEIDHEAGSVNALLPANLQKRLKLPEMTTFRVDAASAMPGEQVLAYGSPLLEDLIQLMGTAGSLASIAVEVDYLKRSGFDEEMGRTVGFSNALASVTRTSTQSVPYLLLRYRYQATSDEQRRGLLSVALNARTLASVVGLEAALPLFKKEEGLPAGSLFSPAADPNALFAKGTRLALSQAQSQIAPFVLSMERRRKNEAGRLYAYYSDLYDEAQAKARRAKEERKASHENRAKAAEGEYAKKIQEINERYVVSLSVEPVSVLLVSVPSVVASVRVRRRSNEAEKVAIYNPLLKRFDAWVCEGCFADTSSLTACDEEVHLTCLSCNRPCSHCKKVSCAACHPSRCGRCNKSRA